MSDHLIALVAIVTLALTAVLVLLAIPPAWDSGRRLYQSWREGRAMATDPASDPPSDPPSEQPQQRFAPFFNLVVAALLLAVFIEIWLENPTPEGFSTGWPDALRCTSYIPNGANQNLTEGVKSENFFYLSATFQVGNRLGQIIRYDYLGGIATLSIADDNKVELDKPHYRRQLVNQVWFAMGGPLKGGRVLRRDSLNVALKPGQRAEDLIIKDKDKILFEALFDGNDVYEHGFADTTRYTPLCGKDDDIGDNLAEIKSAGNAFTVARKF